LSHPPPDRPSSLAPYRPSSLAPSSPRSTELASSEVRCVVLFCVAFIVMSCHLRALNGQRNLGVSLSSDILVSLYLTQRSFVLFLFTS
jgi:hypothetical protein